jgi:serine/threonine protein kinase
MADYEKLKTLGAGNFGEVWLVYDRALAVQRAVKYVARSRISDPTGFYDEPQTLMALRHENIVRVEDAGKAANGTLYIAMEYLPRGSVKDVFEGAPVPLSVAISILQDVCWAVEYAHQAGYIHRDIKPANILLTKEGAAKLSDFGLATRVPQGGTASPYGYLTHVAPDVLKTGTTSAASDVYALGVTAYRLVNGDGFLPDVTDASDIQDLILSGNYPDRKHYRPHIPSQLRRIINRCMAPEPNERFERAAQFRKSLERVRICCDWQFRRKHRIITYIGRIPDAKVKVAIYPDGDGRFEIVTTKRVRDGIERRVGKDCFSGLTLVRMKKRIHQILSRYVSRGR